MTPVMQTNSCGNVLLFFPLPRLLPLPGRIK